MIELTTKEVFVVASGEPTHWGVHVFDVNNSRETSEKLVQKIIENNDKIKELNKIIIDKQYLNTTELLIKLRRILTTEVSNEDI